MMSNIQLEQRPRLSRAARLRFDTKTHDHVLLSPERGLRLNESAAEIVRRCTGKLTVEEIAAQLFWLCGFDPSVSRAEVTNDVASLLTALHARGLLELEPTQ